MCVNCQGAKCYFHRVPGKGVTTIPYWRAGNSLIVYLFNVFYPISATKWLTNKNSKANIPKTPKGKVSHLLINTLDFHYLKEGRSRAKPCKMATNSSKAQYRCFTLSRNSVQGPGHMRDQLLCAGEVSLSKGFMHQCHLVRCSDGKSHSEIFRPLKIFKDSNPNVFNWPQKTNI